MPSFDTKFLQNLPNQSRLFAMTGQIHEYKGKQDLYAQRYPQMLEVLKQQAMIESVESSNRIEGIVTSKERLVALMQRKTEPQNRDEAEIDGYRNVLELIHDNATDIPLTDSVILQFHRDLMRQTKTEGGKWKITANDIVQTMPDGTQFLRFRPTEPHLTPEAMRVLHQNYHNAIKEKIHDPLVLIGLYVLDFLCIHPFLDGNGRTSRLLALLALYHQGFEVGRYISLEKLIELTKDSYYDSLQAASQNWHESQHDPSRWIEYWLGTILSGYRKMKNRAEEFIPANGAKTNMVMAAINRRITDFSIADLQKDCPTISRDWIKHLVYSLRDDGKLISVGQGRGAKWRKVI